PQMAAGSPARALLPVTHQGRAVEVRTNPEHAKRQPALREPRRCGPIELAPARGGRPAMKELARAWARLLRVGLEAQPGGRAQPAAREWRSVDEPEAKGGRAGRSAAARALVPVSPVAAPPLPARGRFRRILAARSGRAAPRQPLHLLSLPHFAAVRSHCRRR